MEPSTASPDRAARLAGLIPDFRDMLVIAGLFVLAAGVWMIYVPAALIVIGAAALCAGLFGVPRWES